MKALFISIIMLGLLTLLWLDPPPAYAVELEAVTRIDSYANEHIDSGKSVQIKGIFDSGIYVVGGLSGYNFHESGQPLLANVDKFAGVGFTFALIEQYVTSYAQIGFTWVGNSMEETYKEAIPYAFDKALPKTNRPWSRNDEIYAEIENHVSGEIGMNAMYPLTSWLDVGINLAYRIAPTVVYYKQLNNEFFKKHDAWWELNNALDMGGPSVGLTFTGRF